jgi:hypothetical protein
MAGFGLGNYINPAVGGFIDQRRNALAGLGAGLLNGQPGAGVQQGIAADSAYAIQQKEQAERERLIAEQQSERNQTTAWIKANFPQYSNLPPAQAWQAAMGDLQAKRSASTGSDLPASAQEYQFAKENGFTGTFPEWMQTGRNGAAGPQLGMTPQWAQDEKGNWVLGQMSSDGRFQPTDMGGLKPVDPLTAAGGKSGAVVDGKTQANARAALPGAQQALAIAENAINLVRNDTAGLDEQFGNTMGVPNRNLPVVPGVFQQAKGNWQANFSQAKGQGFMQAREMLKGGGPITDYEGMKGEAAFSRMEQAVAIGDKETFLLALDDFEAAVRDGYAKLVATANGEYDAGAPAVTGAANYKSKYGLE